MAAQLKTDTAYISQPIPITPPAATVMLPRPLSYDFRVVENVDIDGKIISVRLQYQVWEHDQHGNGTVTQYWQDVQRVKMRDGLII